MNEIVELNYPSTFLEISYLIKQRKLKNRTTVGRLLLIKTSIISKLNLLTLTIPDPSVEYLQQFEKNLLAFIGGQGP